MKYCLHVLAGIINFRNYCQYKGKIRTSNLHLWRCAQLQKSNFHRGHSIKTAHPLPNPFGFIVVHFTLCCKGCVHHTQPQRRGRWGRVTLRRRQLGKRLLLKMSSSASSVDLLLSFIHFYLRHDVSQCLCAFRLAFSRCNTAQIIESTQACLAATPLGPSPHLPAASRWGVYALTHSDTHIHAYSHSCGRKCKQDADGWECVRQGHWGGGCGGVGGCPMKSNVTARSRPRLWLSSDSGLAGYRRNLCKLDSGCFFRWLTGSLTGN